MSDGWEEEFWGIKTGDEVMELEENKSIELESSGIARIGQTETNDTDAYTKRSTKKIRKFKFKWIFSKK